jgi:hypothetical protein
VGLGRDISPPLVSTQVVRLDEPSHADLTADVGGWPALRPLCVGGPAHGRRQER